MKITGPFMSFTASGKFMDLFVASSKYGKAVFRKYIKPVQANSTLQGYVRVVFGSIGFWTGKVDCLKKGGSVDSKVYTLLTAKMPSGMSWSNFANQGFADLTTEGGKISEILFDGIVAEYSALPALTIAEWEAKALLLNLKNEVFPYGYTDPITAGMQLYFGAKACWNNAISTEEPYSLDPATWTVGNVDSFYSDMTTA